MIACLLLPYFAAEVERRANGSLTAKPLLLIDDARKVWGVSQEAAQAGVQPEMALRHAQALCPEATVISAEPSLYEDTFSEVLDLLADFSDRLEPGVGQLSARVYLGLDPVISQIELEKLGDVVRTRTRLAATLGLASGKFPAFVAATAIGPNRNLFVLPGEERSFLAPFSIGYLPLDAELSRRFRLLGLDTLGKFATLPVGAVMTQFGRQGGLLHKLARGEDDRPVSPYPPPPGEEMTRHLDGPVADRLMLDALCQLMATELATRLEQQSQVARVIYLTLQLEDGTAWKEYRILRQPTDSTQRLRLSLSLLLERVQINSGVEAVSVGLADLGPRLPRQLALFADATQVAYEQRLEELLPALVARYGPHFYEALLSNPFHRLPEKRFLLRAWL